MSTHWDAARARKKLRAMPSLLACVAILDQSIFSGAGNIIKNEVLFRTRIHPASTIGALPAAKLRELTKDVRDYSFQFLEWKKAGVLKRNWLAHAKRTCPRCNIPFVEQELGQTQRRSFFCKRCQIKYGSASSRARASRKEQAKPAIAKRASTKQSASRRLSRKKKSPRRT